MKPYHTATINESAYIDETYSLLLGPCSFECFLGEPEDRTWKRDGKDVVKRLNNLHKLAMAYDEIINVLALSKDTTNKLRKLKDKAGLT